jgi:hypothetical protein
MQEGEIDHADSEFHIFETRNRIATPRNITLPVFAREILHGDQIPYHNSACPRPKHRHNFCQHFLIFRCIFVACLLAMAATTQISNFMFFTKSTPSETCELWRCFGLDARYCDTVFDPHAGFPGQIREV